LEPLLVGVCVGRVSGVVHSFRQTALSRLLFGSVRDDLLSYDELDDRTLMRATARGMFMVRRFFCVGSRWMGSPSRSSDPSPAG
jgi:hypothetical protein